MIVFSKEFPVSRVFDCMENIIQREKFTKIDMNIMYGLYIATEARRRHGGKIVLLPCTTIENGEAVRDSSRFLPDGLDGVEFVFQPMAYKDHWVLVVLGQTGSKLGLKVYDSFKMFSNSFQRAVSTFEEILQDRYSIRLRRTQWAICTQQSSNSTFCGLYTIAYAISLLQDTARFQEENLELGSSFEEKGLPILRDTLLLQILRCVR